MFTNFALAVGLYKALWPVRVTFLLADVRKFKNKSYLCAILNVQLPRQAVVIPYLPFVWWW